MTIRLLGTLELVDAEGRQIEIGGAQPRVILAMLVAASGRFVTADALIGAIWDEAPPQSAMGTLQTYVSRLRRALADVAATIEHESGGYRLVIARDAVDVDRFEGLLDQARLALDAGDPAAARTLLVEAEGLWRGPALLEVRDRPRVAGIARRLDDRRLAALEDRLATDLALGRHADVVPELAQLVAEHPLRERLWELLALARFRSGLQADALRALAAARDTLVESLGVEPGAGLRDLERAILAHDPALDYVAPAERHVGPARVEVAGGPDRATPATHPLIGRNAELAVLLRALDAAATGRPGIAVVQGEAGVGKTRLVEELATHAARCAGAAVWGRALEGDAAPAYWPWLSVLRTLRATNPSTPHRAVQQLLDGTGTASPVAAPGDGSRLLGGVLQMLRCAPAEGASCGPLVVVIEDVQWADAESLELTTRLVSGLTDEPVLLVLTMRDGDDARRNEVIDLLAAVARRRDTHRVRLDGLSLADTAALLAELSGHPIDDELARVVHARAEGNPFYAIELQRLLDADGLDDASAIGAVGVPVGVRDVVRQRLGRLPVATLELLRLAAVAGRDIDIELLSRASGRPIDECVDALDVALEHQLLTDRDGCRPRFAHALVREVVAAELSSLRRARAHLALADAILAAGGGDDQAEIVAEHLCAAAPIGAGRRAADALDRAADVAIGRFAVGTAGELLARSLELRRSAGADAAEELGTIVKLVWALRTRFGYQGGLAHYPRAIELANRLGRDDIALEMQWAEWAGHDTACTFDRARPAAVRFRDWATATDDPAVKLCGLTAWAIQCWHDGDLTEAAATFRIVADVRATIESRGPAGGVLGTELTVLSTAFGLLLDEQLGRLVDPDAAFTAAAESAAGNFPAAILWTMATSSATSAGDLERMERYSRRVLAAEAGETLGFWGSQARMYLGAALIATGRVHEGRELFAAGRAGYATAGMRTGLALMLAEAASAEVRAGDLDRAAAHLAAAHEELVLGERWPVPLVLLAAADLAAASGACPDDVAALRREAEAIARAQGAVRVAERARVAAATDAQPARPPTAELTVTSPSVG